MRSDGSQTVGTYITEDVWTVGWDMTRELVHCVENLLFLMICKPLLIIGSGLLLGFLNSMLILMNMNILIFLLFSYLATSTASLDPRFIGRKTGVNCTFLRYLCVYIYSREEKSKEESLL